MDTTVFNKVLESKYLMKSEKYAKIEKWNTYIALVALEMNDFDIVGTKWIDRVWLFINVECRTQNDIHLKRRNTSESFGA